MIQRINLAISKFRVGIFVVAALYKFTFWIINMVNAFQNHAAVGSSGGMIGGSGGGAGVYILFDGLFSMLIELVMLAILLEVSRKIAEKYTQSDFAAPAAPQLNYNGYNAAPQAPVQPQMQVPPQAPVQPQAQAPAQPAASGVWYCSGCGTQNTADAAFCANCGKPK